MNAVEDLKGKTIRGGATRAGAVIAGFGLRLGSTMVLARLLSPADFGLLGMVTAFTGVLNLFRDFGLSAATVQRASISKEQASTLFWINLAVGGILTLLTVLLAPAVAGFYHEPRLARITSVVAFAFLVNGAGVQHSALLQREMRFTALTAIDIVSWTAAAVVGIGAAKAGFGYWALVGMTLTLPVASTAALWFWSTWIPGLPGKWREIQSMMHFGGLLTLNGLVLYGTFNLDKVLLGRFWGTEALGIYGRAYQLIRIPTDNLNGVVGEVAFSALSRVQNDAERLKRYFLRGYFLVLAVTVPLTVACAVFSNDLIRVLLGPKWNPAAPIFRYLAPSILVFAVTNPLGWLLNALGLVKRGLLIALVLAPLMITGYFLGLRFGPQGVAVAYSSVMLLWVGPVMAWAVKGTGISFGDLGREISHPLASVAGACAVTAVVRSLYARTLSPLPRVSLDVTVLFLAYGILLLFVAGRKPVFLEILHGWRPPHKNLPARVGLSEVD